MDSAVRGEYATGAATQMPPFRAAHAPRGHGGGSAGDPAPRSGQRGLGACASGTRALVLAASQRSPRQVVFDDDEQRATDADALTDLRHAGGANRLHGIACVTRMARKDA